MDKIGLALLVIGFWLFLPIPMGLLGVGGYSYVSESTLDVANQNAELNLVNFITEMGKLFKVYFALIFFTIPQAPIYVNFFLLFFKSASVFLAIIMIRGN